MDDTTTPEPPTPDLLAAELRRQQRLQYLDLTTRRMRLSKAAFLTVRPSRIVPGKLVVPPDIGQRQAIPIAPYGDGQGWTHPIKGFTSIVSLPNSADAAPLNLRFMLIEETSEEYVFMLLTAFELEPPQSTGRSGLIVPPN